MFVKTGLIKRLRKAVIRGFVPGIAFFSAVFSIVMPAYTADPAGDVSRPSPYKGINASDRRIELPTVLSASDTALYTQIFSLQESGQWRKADSLIKQLGNPILLGHVLAQRYLHPTKYRSKYKELKEWLALYNDHPEAARLYKLALRRKPSNWKRPKAPARIAPRTTDVKKVAARSIRIPGKRLSRANRRKVNGYKSQVRRALRRGYTLVAKRVIQSKQAQKLLSTAEFDELRAKLGQAYFSAGRDKWALNWAGAAAKRSGKFIPQAHWTTGLAHWRLGNRDAAAEHFAKAAELSQQDDWFHAGAAFWAARAFLVTRQPERVNHFLLMAAEHRRTFYGQLAGRVLGHKDQFSWDIPTYGRDSLAHLSTLPAGQRSMALLQTGQVHRAETELKRLALGADPALANGILAIAAFGNMASLAVKLDYQLYPNGGGFDGAAYPIPNWEPSKGFSVDRALIYALIHQESKFNPKAKSWAGARGLMQLMPGTASFVARDRAYRGSKRSRLFKPEHNIDLGQRYIEILLKDKKINGDLFLLAAAWNGGPGNLNKWRRKNSYKNDPLFFIESIPSRETRIFIERVLANLWIYRDRLSQPTPSLDAIAKGDWPVYMALGQQTEEVAEIHGTRK
jgi:soluble lytic murein transglycosylase